MRIVHVVDSLEVGGAETIVVQLCRAQAQAGHAPSVSCLYARGPLEAELNGIPVHLHGPAPIFILVLRLWRHFRALRPDVVHCHNATATIAAARAAKRVRARVISTRHGLVPSPMNRSRKFWPAAGCCNRVVAVCNAARENLIAGAPTSQRGKIVTVYNGVADINAERSVETGLAPPLSASDGKFVLVTVGRLNPIKAQSVMLEAVAVARKRAPELRLWLVGDGPERSRLEALAARLELGDAVKFWGEQREVGTYLRAADLFVLSSDSEGLPMSLLEAMAAGRACVTTDVGGMTEVVRGAGCGELVPARDPQALAAAMVRLAQSPKKLQVYEQAARSAWEQRFTLARMAADYERLYSGGETSPSL
jgi:glycosyltransferase involved in cell wall biosynthesis